MNLHNLRDDNDRLSREAAGMRRASAILGDLADVVSRGRLDTVDVPRQLRRVAASLADGASSLQRITELNAQCSWQRNFLLYFRNEVHRLRMQLHHKLREETDTERLTWPPDYAAKLAEMEHLLHLLFETSGDLAAAEYCQAAPTGTHVAMLGAACDIPEHS